MTEESTYQQSSDGLTYQHQRWLMWGLGVAIVVGTNLFSWYGGSTNARIVEGEQVRNNTIKIVDYEVRLRIIEAGFARIETDISWMRADMEKQKAMRSQ